MENKYRFGGMVFRILSPEGLKTVDKYEAFCAGPEDEADLTYELIPVENGDRTWGAGPLPQERTGNHIRIPIDSTVLPNVHVAGLFSGAYTSWLLPEFGRFVLHCSYVLHEGQAILFCAPSGTGKSTQADFWKACRGSVTVNEDRAILMKRDGVWYACGCWATGKGVACENVTAPVRALVLLFQGPENSGRKAGAVEAFCHVLPQCSYDAKDHKQCETITGIVADFLGAVKTVRYACINHPSAVDDLERYL